MSHKLNGVLSLKEHKLNGSLACVHSSGDIMYTRTGDYFGKTKNYYDGHVNRVILTIATPLMII